MASAALQGNNNNNTARRGSASRVMMAYPRIDRPNLDTLRQQELPQSPSKQQPWTAGKTQPWTTGGSKLWTVQQPNWKPDTETSLWRSRKLGGTDTWTTNNEAPRLAGNEQGKETWPTGLRQDPWNQEMLKGVVGQQHPKQSVTNGTTNNRSKEEATLITWNPGTNKGDQVGASVKCDPVMWAANGNAHREGWRKKPPDGGAGTSRSTNAKNHSPRFFREHSEMTTIGSRYQGGQPLDQVAANQKSLREATLATSQRVTRGVTQPHRVETTRLQSQSITPRRQIPRPNVLAPPSKSGGVLYQPKTTTNTRLTAKFYPPTTTQKMTPIHHGPSTTRRTVIAESTRKMDDSSHKEICVPTAPSTPGASTVLLPNYSLNTTTRKPVNVLPSVSNVVPSPKQRERTYRPGRQDESLTPVSVLLHRLNAKPLNPSRIIKEAPSQIRSLCTSPNSDYCYKLSRVLQSAIYGGVYEAEAYLLHKVLSTPPGQTPKPVKRVAIKIMLRDLEIQHRDSLQEDITAELRFQSEMKGHDNVLAYEELWESKSRGIVFVVMPFAEFEDLFEVLKRRAVPFSEPEARWLFRQLLEGVKFLHSRGLGFRDHSLENVLMFRDEKDGFTVRPKITDPGQAVRLQYDSERRIIDLQAEKLFGKSFRPPEVYHQKRYNPIKVDVFCMGWMLFFVVTKRQPFDRSLSSDPNWPLIKRGKIEDLLKMKGNVKLTPELVELLQKMMHHDHRERYDPRQCLAHPWFRHSDCAIDDRTVWADNPSCTAVKLGPHPKGRMRMIEHPPPLTSSYNGTRFWMRPSDVTRVPYK